MSTACLIIFSAAGVLYIEALRVRLQAVRDARLALHADKRFSAYVYALPILAYMVVTSAALFRGMAHEKSELCMFALISGLLLALYKTPTSRAAKLIVWENATERCCVWLPSASCTLSTAQQRIADAMDVKPATRIRFAWGDVAEGEDLAADLDLTQSVMPLFISQVGQSPLTDFFGFPVTVCQIIVAEEIEMAAAAARGGALAAGDSSPGRSGRFTPRKSVYKQPQVPSTPTEPESKPSMLSKLFPSSRKKAREARAAGGAAESSGHSADKEPPRDSESSSLDTSTPAKAIRKWPFLLKSRSSPSKHATGEATAADTRISKEAIQGLSPPRSPSPLPSPLPTPSSSPRTLSLRRSSSTPSLSSKRDSISPSRATNSSSTGVAASGGGAIDPEARTRLHTAPKPRKEQIEAYVDAILRDPTMNLAGIPDNIEKKIYTIGISLALTACLKVIFSANGKTILGHHVELEVRPQPKFPAPPTRATGSELRKIEKLVDELLKEEMINLKWLPDRYEKPLYVNVISAVITVMQSVFAAAKVDFLGQVMAVKIGPSEEDEDGESGDGGDEMMATARRFSQRMISMRRVSEEVLDEQLDIHFATSGHVHWLLSDRRERAMLKTVYALVLCSIDEIFKELKINFIGDEVRFHLIAGPMPDPPPEEAAAAAQHGKKGSLSGDKTNSAGAATAGGGGAAGGGAAGRGGAGNVYGQHELILAALAGALLGCFLFR